MQRARWGGLLIVIALTCSACTRADNPHRRPAGIAAPSGHATVSSSRSAVTKLLTLVVENHSLEQMSNQMPYTFGLATKFGYATDYFAVAHPSLPNYLAITSGSTHGISDDAPPAQHPVASESVFAQAGARGSTAGLYADGMPTHCATTNGGNEYAVKHNPWAYYTRERSACLAGDKPLSALPSAVASGRLPNVGMVIPNMCHDAHNCSLQVADTWIKGVMENIFTGPDWRSGHLAIVITADEDDLHHRNKILTVVVHPSQHAHVVAAKLTHYSLSRMYSDVVGARPLKRAADAPSMSKAFGLRLR